LTDPFVPARETRDKLVRMFARRETMYDIYQMLSDIAIIKLYVYLKNIRKFQITFKL